MKRFLLSSFILVSAAGGAAAADASVDAAHMADRHDWTGVYFGGHAGYAWAETDVTELDYYTFSGSGDSRFGFRSDAAMGGLHAGVGWQVGSFVYGIEADISASGIDKTVPNSMLPGSGESFSTRIEWYGTVRGRLGFAADRFLSYVTGGLAFGHVESSYNDPLENFPFADGNYAIASDVAMGWTLGAGADYAIDGNWIVGVAYQYVDLADSRGSMTHLLGGTYRYDFDNNLQVLRLDFSYKF